MPKGYLQVFDELVLRKLERALLCVIVSLNFDVHGA